MPTNPPEPPFDPYDPRMDENSPTYDPRLDPRNDPRYDPGAGPRFSRVGSSRSGPDPTDGPAYDARRGDPRYDRRPADDPRYAPAAEPRQDRARAAPPVAATTRRRRLPWWAILAGLIGLIAVALFAFSLTRGNPDQDRLGDAANNTAAADPETAATERCGSQGTYDLMKRELFRRAAQVRGSDAGVFDRLGAYTTIRVQDPVAKRQDEEVGTLVCSGQVALDLPPGLGVVGGRRTLTAAVDYSVTPAADGSGNVLTLEGADPIVVPLATLARTGDGASPPQAPEAADSSQATENSGLTPAPAPAAPAAPQPAPQPAPLARPAAPEPSQPQATATARPSFNCANARTRGELAVCRDSGLASLDRQMAGIYVSTLRDAPPQQRALLQRTRDRFLGYRDQCGSDACVAGAYRDRIREIRDIANDRWNP